MCVSRGKGSLDALHGRDISSSKTVGYILLAPLKPALFSGDDPTALHPGHPAEIPPLTMEMGEKKRMMSVVGF